MQWKNQTLRLNQNAMRNIIPMEELQAEKLSTKFQMNNSAFFYDLATQLRIFVANESLPVQQRCIKRIK